MTRRRTLKPAPDNGLVGPALRNNIAAEARYARELKALARELEEAVRAEVVALMESPQAERLFATDAASLPERLAALMTRLRSRFAKVADRQATRLAATVVKDAAKRSESGLKSALEQVAERVTIKVPTMTGRLGTIYDASVAENVSLIKSIPPQYLDKVEGAVMRSVTSGRGLADLIPDLEKLNGGNTKRAEMIARDQTRKVYNAINRTRLQEMGLRKFEWVHSGGANEPRPLHVSYNGKVFEFEDPPVIDERTGEKGFPGQLIACGCVMKPVWVFEGED